MSKNIRVMWLLNQQYLSISEIDMLKSVGVEEIYIPKSHYCDNRELSVVVDVGSDYELSIPKDEIEILNRQNWFENPSKDAWNIANKYFEIIFIGFLPKQINSTSINFDGQIVLRVFGLEGDDSYSNSLRQILKPGELVNLFKVKNRLWFGTGYKCLKYREEDFLKDRDCYLPVVKSLTDNFDSWTGNNNKIYFDCPRILISKFHNHQYENFKRDFKDFEYTIGGDQPIKVVDEAVIGSSSRDDYKHDLRDHKLMFYYDSEPDIFDCKLFEAIEIGLPLIFMANGVLDRLGGRVLPGRCKSIREARRKIQKIVSGDKKFIRLIRSTQKILLQSVSKESSLAEWKSSFNKIIDKVLLQRKVQNLLPLEYKIKRKKIAVLLPIEYRGGSLRAAKMVAEAIYRGSALDNQKVEVVFGYLKGDYSDLDFSDLSKQIKRREFTWKIVTKGIAETIFKYKNFPKLKTKQEYYVPDDGISYFSDCDLLVIISDRLLKPLLPTIPYVNVVYDYLQRYEDFLQARLNEIFLHVVHNAKKVIVTTKFTKGDAINFAGLSEDSIELCPHLVPDYTNWNNSKTDDALTYFIWTTNLAPHKNSLEALRIYYDKLGGKLKCITTGLNTDRMFEENLEHLKLLKKIVTSSKKLKSNFKLLGNLAEEGFQSLLSNSAFLWHSARNDNGTYSVLEAASYGVPSLSAKYPAMIEINECFNLNMMFMDPWDPEDMALKLKQMELEIDSRRNLVPSFANISNYRKQAAIKYWDVIKGCL